MFFLLMMKSKARPCAPLEMPSVRAAGAGSAFLLFSSSTEAIHTVPHLSEGLLEPEQIKQCLVVKSWGFWSWEQAELTGSRCTLQTHVGGWMTDVSLSLCSSKAGPEPPRCLSFPQSSHLSYPSGFSTNSGTRRADTHGWEVFGDPLHKGDAYS